MLEGICVLPIIPMRVNKSDKSEMINQVLFGESFKVLQQDKKWSKIILNHDNYCGWIDNKQYQIIPKINNKFQISNKKYTNIKIANTQQPLLLGSFIPKNRKLINIINIEESLSFCEMLPFRKWFLKIAKKYINTPYLWGGRSPLGIDCSGYTQMVYRFFNYNLPRDAFQQEKKGEKITNFSKIKLGDLAFFGDKKTSHVGIILSQSKIIHASGKVRIDNLDQKGIYNSETNLYTHKLKSIKRILAN